MENSRQENIDIVACLWSGKWIVVVFTAIFAILSVVISITLPNVYRSDTLLAPVAADGGMGGGLASLTGQFGGLASMAGLSLGGVKTDKTLLAIEYLRSRTFIIDFINRHDLKVPIMAASGWERETGKLEINPDMYNENEDRWVRIVDKPKQPEPSAWETYEVFLEMITVEKDGPSGLVRLSIEHYSPDLAYQWVTLLVSDINSFMRDKDTVEAGNSIKFLQQQIDETSIAGMREVIYGLVEEQLKTKMLAEVREEYIFSYVDPPFKPEQKFKPSRAVICVVGTFSGGLIGCLAVLFGALFRTRKSEMPDT